MAKRRLMREPVVENETREEDASTGKGIYVNLNPAYSRALEQAKRDLNLTQPEIVGRLLKWFIENKDYQVLLLGLQHPEFRLAHLLLLLKRIEPDVRAQLKAIGGRSSQGLDEPGGG